ncbi:MAG: MATE family efflux transporter [Alphaproteobacteria bacterium]|nr:MATE family efflux transporter [Alphaproteobacteria bacterium]
MNRGWQWVTWLRRQLLPEFVETLRLAVPMMLTQLGQIAMTTSDLALIGRLGEDAVAAAALAHTVYFCNFTLGIGLVIAVSPLAAQAFARDNVRGLRRALRAGLWLALLSSAPMMVSPLCGGPILRALGQAPELAALAEHYLWGLAFGIAPALGFVAMRGFMAAVNRPRPPLWIILAAIPANIVLVYCLIHGVCGLPRLGLQGAGVATSLVNFGTFVAAVAIVARGAPFAHYHPFARLWRIDWALMRRLVAIGVPISSAMLMEYGVFASAAVLMGWIGTTALAAHQVALQITAVLFVLSLGIGMAATVRVAQARGRDDVEGIRRAGLVAGLMGAGTAVVLTVAVVMTRYSLARLFLGSAEVSRDAVELSATLLLVGGTFFIADGLQTIMAGALRGLNDTRMTVLFAACGYWCVGFPLALLLGFGVRLGAIGVWIGLAVGTLVYAGLLILRFRLLAATIAWPWRKG